MRKATGACDVPGGVFLTNNFPCSSLMRFCGPRFFQRQKWGNSISIVHVQKLTYHPQNISMVIALLHSNYYTLNNENLRNSMIQLCKSDDTLFICFQGEQNFQASLFQNTADGLTLLGAPLRPVSTHGSSVVAQLLRHQCAVTAKQQPIEIVIPSTQSSNDTTCFQPSNQ